MSLINEQAYALQLRDVRAGLRISTVRRWSLLTGVPTASLVYQVPNDAIFQFEGAFIDCTNDATVTPLEFDVGVVFQGGVAANIDSYFQRLSSDPKTNAAFLINTRYHFDFTVRATLLPGELAVVRGFTTAGNWTLVNLGLWGTTYPRGNVFPG